MSTCLYRQEYTGDVINRTVWCITPLHFPLQSTIILWYFATNYYFRQSSCRQLKLKNLLDQDFSNQMRVALKDVNFHVNLNMIHIHSFAKWCYLYQLFNSQKSIITVILTFKYSYVLWTSHLTASRRYSVNETSVKGQNQNRASIVKARGFIWKRALFHKLQRIACCHVSSQTSLPSAWIWVLRSYDSKSSLTTSPEKLAFVRCREAFLLAVQALNMRCLWQQTFI